MNREEQESGQSTAPHVELYELSDIRVPKPRHKQAGAGVRRQPSGSPGMQTGKTEGSEEKMRTRASRNKEE